MYDISHHHHHRASPFAFMTAAAAAAAATSGGGGSAVGGGGAGGGAMERIWRMAEENAVVIFSLSSCCMCHVVKSLLCSLGVNPTVYELDEEGDGGEMEEALASIVGNTSLVPTVFVGGKLLGGLDQVMAAHISGNLVPQLKEAGALWL